MPLALAITPPSDPEPKMNSKHLPPLRDYPQPKLCPVCGKASYSAKGIHPQCAVSQADEPRRLKLAAERRAKVDLEKKSAPAKAK